LAPRAYVTYYQARGLSGHTSPSGECVYFFDPYALFTLLTFLFRNTSGHTSPARKSFSFSQEHHAFFGQPTFFGNNGGRLYYKLIGHLQQLLSWCFDWSETSRIQASLFGEGQDGVSHHNE
jgi:hypothetical protein